MYETSNIEYKNGYGCYFLRNIFNFHARTHTYTLVSYKVISK